MRTATELGAVIGKTGTYRLDGAHGFSVWVKVLDTRERFGEVDYLISPVAGEGQRWVVSYKVRDVRQEGES